MVLVRSPNPQHLIPLANPSRRWADVPPTRHDSVSLQPCHHASPRVKYRGIFLNDEQPGLTNWANKRFHKGNNPSTTDPLGQSFTVDMYESLFELLLRLKANLLWPAMVAALFLLGKRQADPNMHSGPTCSPSPVSPPCRATRRMGMTPPDRTKCSRAKWESSCVHLAALERVRG